jgi:hypothetical protein
VNKIQIRSKRTSPQRIWRVQSTAINWIKFVYLKIEIVVSPAAEKKIRIENSITEHGCWMNNLIMGENATFPSNINEIKIQKSNKFIIAGILAVCLLPLTGQKAVQKVPIKSTDKSRSEDTFYFRSHKMP